MLLLLLLSRFSRVQLCATHRRQPTRLPHPWDSPGKNTGVGWHFLSNAWKWKVKVKSLSRVRLQATPWAAAYQAPPSMEFARQEYWSGLPLPYSLNWKIHVLHQLWKILSHYLYKKMFFLLFFPYTQFSSVTQSCVTLCNPMNCSIPSLPVHHQLPEFTQTQVHRAGDAIQPSHPLSSPSPAPNPSQHQSLFQWVISSHEVLKVLKFQL